MERKRQAEQQRKETDDYNLSLQSFQYERNHYQREIYFCKEYKTPQLSLVIQKAQERQTEDDSRLFKSLQGGPISEDKYALMIAYLKQTLVERQ